MVVAGGIIYPGRSGKAFHRLWHLCREPCNMKEPALEDWSGGDEMSQGRASQGERLAEQRLWGQVEHLGLEVEAGGLGFYSKHGRRLYSFPMAALTDDHKLSVWKQPKFVLSWFWRAEDWNERVSRATLHPKAQGRILPVSPSSWWLQVFLGLWEHRWLQSWPPSSYGFLLHVCVSCRLLSLMKDMGHWI